MQFNKVSWLLKFLNTVILKFNVKLITKAFLILIASVKTLCCSKYVAKFCLVAWFISTRLLFLSLGAY